MSRQLFKDIFLWGFLLWLFGYILGIVFYMFLPKPLIGWAIMPLGILFALWVLLKKIRLYTLREYLLLGAGWVLIAVIFDYIFLVQLFKTGISYYKADVFLYYLITFLLPFIGYWRKKEKR